MSTTPRRRRYSAVALVGNYSAGRYTSGNNPNFREHAIASIGIAQEKNRKPVINTETGEIYKSVTEAAEKTGLSWYEKT